MAIISVVISASESHFSKTKNMVKMCFGISESLKYLCKSLNAILTLVIIGIVFRKYQKCEKH